MRSLTTIAFMALFMPLTALSSDTGIKFSGAVKSGATCSVNSQNLNVTLPTIRVGDLKSNNSTTGETPFSISLNCDRGVKVSFVLQKTINTSGFGFLDYNILPDNFNEVTGAGTGLHVQIIDAKTKKPIKISLTSIIDNNLVTTTDSSGQLQIPLLVRYIKKGDQYHAGVVKLALVFTMVYE